MLSRENCLNFLFFSPLNACSAHLHLFSSFSSALIDIYLFLSKTGSCISALISISAILPPSKLNLFYLVFNLLLHCLPSYPLTRSNIVYQIHIFQMAYVSCFIPVIHNLIKIMYTCCLYFLTSCTYLITF